MLSRMLPEDGKLGLSNFLECSLFNIFMHIFILPCIIKIIMQIITHDK